ncbi:MAG TPA: heavy-metal-associated domain-containing protein [Solirubrobacteraceae bacterium]|jgi:copper chaperone CopZ
MAEHIYAVVGMTCARCAAAVTAEVSAIPTAEIIEVALDSERRTVRGTNIDHQVVKSGVEEAGYTLV